MINCNILSTGSWGNAVILEKSVLIDCGVNFRALRPVYRDLKLVLLTHKHADHFKRNTVRKLAKERPTLRWGCCEWMVEPLVAAGVEKANIDVLEPDKTYAYGLCMVTPISLVHDVPNCGYKLHFPAGKVLYATDTNNLHGIEAPDYDLYLIEANYEDEDLQRRIEAKRESGNFAYEYSVMKNHLSKAKAEDFIYANAGPDSRYIYLHCHRDKDNEEDEHD